MLTYADLCWQVLAKQVEAISAEFKSQGIANTLTRHFPDDDRTSFEKSLLGKVCVYADVR
jgi:hypothetical protein